MARTNRLTMNTVAEALLRSKSLEGRFLWAPTPLGGPPAPLKSAARGASN